MKKFVFSFLSLVLACLITAPAFAGGGGDDDGPLPKQCGVDIPEGSYKKDCPRPHWLRKDGKELDVTCRIKEKHTMTIMVPCEKIKACNWKLRFIWPRTITCE